MLPVLSREVVEGKQRVAILDQALDSLVVFDAPGFDEGVERGECILPGRGHPDLLECTSLDLIQRSMSDYVIHSTAGIIGEVDSILSRMHSTGGAGASEARVLDNIDPLAKLAAKR